LVQHVVEQLQTMVEEIVAQGETPDGDHHGVSADNALPGALLEISPFRSDAHAEYRRIIFG
jgi:hypothetical protein